MHEVSVALAMVDELNKIAENNNAKKILAVRLKIGKMSGIVTDSLKFAFDAVKLEHSLISSADILIEEVPLVYQCNNCRKVFSAEDYYFPSCPDCESYNLLIQSGEEQDIESVQLEV